MAARNPDVRKLASSKAANTRWGRPTESVARELAEAQLEDYIRKVVDQAPPLTDEQRARLSLLLRGTAA